MAVVPDIDHLSSAITHATAPAFMLGAVAGFLSILTVRLERILDRNRALQAEGVALEASVKETVAKSFSRRMALLSNAIYLAVLSALVTATLLIAAFAAALTGLGHGAIVAVLFTVALGLLMASLVQFAREIRLQMATMHLDA